MPLLTEPRLFLPDGLPRTTNSLHAQDAAHMNTLQPVHLVRSQSRILNQLQHRIDSKPPIPSQPLQTVEIRRISTHQFPLGQLQLLKSIFNVAHRLFSRCPI